MSFQLSYLFTDHMVLQRDKMIAVFGTGKTGSKITVSLLDDTGAVVNSSARVPMTVTGVITDSKFLVYLPPLPAGGPYTLTATDGAETLEYHDVLLGDLWLAGGQSNMEFNLQSCDEYKDMLAEVKAFCESADAAAGGNVTMKNADVTPVDSIPYNLIRHYFVPHISYIDDNTETARRASVWNLCTPETIPYWSAVAFFFARRLVPELNVPIGIINCNWGGTSASSWLDNQTLMSDLDTAHYYDRYEKATKGLTMEEYLAALETYKKEIQAWDEKKNACYAKDPDIDWNQVIELCGPCPWPGPMGPHSEFRPCGLYDTMLQSCVPYTLKGFLWYQGESDEGYADTYPKLMRGVIEAWRREFRDEELPFLFVQLPMFKNKFDPEYTSWADLREAQMKVFRSVKNTGMAVALDLGKFNDIHPSHKLECGERLALQALYHVYGRIAKPEEAFGPMFRCAVPDGDGLKLYFDYVPEGFVIDYKAVNYTPEYPTVAQPTPAMECSPQYILGFEVQHRDGNWQPAIVTPFCEDGVYGLRLTALYVPQPVHARYAWRNWAPVTVFGTNGLPLAPFRC